MSDFITDKHNFELRIDKGYLMRILIPYINNFIY